MKQRSEVSCPVCGYYCLGKGGLGCIDKTTYCFSDKTSEDLLAEITIAKEETNSLMREWLELKKILQLQKLTH